MDLDTALLAYIKGELNPLTSQKMKNLIDTKLYIKQKALEWQSYMAKMEYLSDKTYPVPRGYREQLTKKLSKKINYLPWVGALTIIPGLLLVLGIHLAKKNKAA
ncbi:MAG: hypothetical protein DDT40_01002 [candidate division WS2 bacterium]|uniref:Uncharacterized protein n=1 Tax=Psychracetigena formicireducens TaxID=2986056 RepID=A0A9E2F6X6_PSYF1|nr:hypothetical protein [Candidatus Psychracetigena formicireducens]MBT9145800.1 hypothetical protein [Candidatus Psychracetigena formicireducens]MBT9150823.1 hypothetical protein [Candidatus Psychracetigena formicireducens]